MHDEDLEVTSRSVLISVQGEGKFVGVPSVFLRTFGCNFRCMNFGLGKDEPSRAEKQAEVKDTIKK